ncbi:hypothetical protein [Gordonia amicalis]|uniref:hypothetical protein n=1 Tax=Gordonia amicalis TaxID=89053 RepID=UPI0015F6ABE8|nr:hypothetical protein [Gordonia amicalis]MBA5846865.1 hypothetical protein [Gordonia amicalis]
MACLATTFTFEPAFFEEDCLSRFLSLPSLPSEGDQITRAVAEFESEERQRDVQVSVLVDRTFSADKRALSWDILPVAVRGGCFHPKVTLLIWEHFMRITVASANLTVAGYRKNIEIAQPLEVHDTVSTVRIEVVEALLDELEHYVTLVSPAQAEPRARALETVAVARGRLESTVHPANGAFARIAVAPSRPQGPSPLDQLPRVWSGPKPLRATVLAPYWDSIAPMPMLTRLRSELTGLPIEEHSLVAVTAVNPFTNQYDAPSQTRAVATEVRAFQPFDEELRTLHAKVTTVEGRDTVAALIGSSNATAAAFGLANVGGNYECNLWIAAPSQSKTGRSLRRLIPVGSKIEDADLTELPEESDDSEEGPLGLPLFFSACLLDIADSSIRVCIDTTHEWPSEWRILTPSGATATTSTEWTEHGRPSEFDVSLPGSDLPNCVIVEWNDQEDIHRCAWALNVIDRRVLPPSQGSVITLEMILAALASGRPISEALERSCRVQTVTNSTGVDLDPHKRVDDSGFLLRQARFDSAALWNLQRHLALPARSVEAIACRLSGRFGPRKLAEELVSAGESTSRTNDSVLFLIAELALTLANVEWSNTGVEERKLQPLLTDEIDALSTISKQMDSPSAYLQSYLDKSFREALRCIGN